MRAASEDTAANPASVRNAPRYDPVMSWTIPEKIGPVVMPTMISSELKPLIVAYDVRPK